MITAARSAKRTNTICGHPLKYDRFSRDAATVEDLIIKEGLNLFSVKKGETNTLRLLEIAARKAEKQGQDISRLTKDALDEMKAQGIKLGNPASLPAATQKSLKVRQLRSHEIVLNIADFLKTNPRHSGKTVPELVDILNAAGIRTGWGRLWTDSALRLPLKRAREEVELRRQLQGSDFDGPSAADEKTLASSPIEDDRSAEPEDHYRNVPNYNRF